MSMLQFGSIASIRPRSARVLCRSRKDSGAGHREHRAKPPEAGSVVSVDQWHLRLANLNGYQIEIERLPYIAQSRRFQVERAETARFLKIIRKWLLSQDGNKEALRIIFARRGRRLKRGRGRSIGQLLCYQLLRLLLAALLVSLATSQFYFC